MADTVQFRLERMVDELDDLERRGLFTRREIAEIVKRRRKFEYRLKRPSPIKQDFLAYIDYETQLDNLRRLRKKSVARELKRKGNKKMKMSVSDFSGVSRIVEIYRMAVMRFKGDIELWFRYLEFCRERRNGRMKKVLSHVIRLHPKVAGVWIYAAAWEFDHNLNVIGARALMQSGLRVSPNSEDLWVEYLRMELTYLNKLKARKVALGEGKGSFVLDSTASDEKQWREENKDLFMSLTDERAKDDGSNVDNELEKKNDLFREQALNVLQTVYNGAVEALPSSFGLRVRLLEILEAIDFANSRDMYEKILSEMKRDFSKDPEYWDWLARRQIDGTDLRSVQGRMSPELENAIQVYEEALEIVSSHEMFRVYTKFLIDVIDTSEGKLNPGLPNHYEDCISRLLMVFEKAEALGCMTEDLASDYVSFYLQLGRVDEARKLAEKLCGGKYSDSSKLWLLRASIETRGFTRDISFPNKADLSSIFQLVRIALTKVPIEEANNLWMLALKFFAAEKHYFDKLVEMSFILVAKDGGGENGYSVPWSIVNFVLQKDGIESARETYKRFLALPHPGLALYKSCIELERNLASIGDVDGLANVRKLYDSALASYSQNMNLWRDYYTMERKLGTSETTAAVCWRARKTLKNSVEFLASDIL
ncbi:hypothetical protein K2173_004674 [Erythroxylum novogranatense]|uniref:U3 small nucleolar RNA-associated protein 6 n=1 Tax=Erythroxylum novogranatense TaxID=1862640 RepID=A0AAV8T6E5_9ROSI|nr:hypothetical protein K2173_004674 [Erythroxylum novogranatense]